MIVLSFEQMSDWDCFVTTFTTLHNETWNIWTHLIPAFVHLWLLATTDWVNLHPAAVIPAFFSVCVTVCLLLSARYHMFMAAAPDVGNYRALLRADVVGVTTCFLGATTCMLWLPLACVDWRIKAGFLFVTYALSTAFVVFANSASGRGVGFMVLVGSMLVSVASRVQSVFAVAGSVHLWVIGLSMLIIGGVINVARIPERWAPPTLFDFAFNSHFIMHVFTGFASFLCLIGAFEDLQVLPDHPQLQLCAIEQFPVPQWGALAHNMGEIQRLVAPYFGAEYKMPLYEQ